jgi:autotransporter-associated beta strand protein
MITKKTLFLFLGGMMPFMATLAQNTTIDISGNNTADSYKSYDKAISLPAGNTVDVKMARYCYFSSTITGKGKLNLYAGGERCYLGTEKGAKWPTWTNYSGDIHIFPFKENSSSAGFYGVVLAHGGKSFSPENIDDGIRSGKVNPSMQSNHVTLHAGATICCEANNAGAGFRIGHLDTEEGSTLQGYMKNSRAAYYLLGSLNTDFTLAGTIAPSSYRDDTPLGIIKEGKGTLTITGNQNYLSGALRVLEGRVLVMNDRAQAESKKQRGALGARPNDTEAIAYIFGKGVLGGMGSIGGAVDNYGTIEPGSADTTGLLTLQNYVTPSKAANLIVHPSSVLRFKVRSQESYDRLAVAGTVKYSDMTEDFASNTAMPIVEVSVLDSLSYKAGTEFIILTAKAKSGEWQFQLKQPGKGTWAVEERTADGQYQLVLRLVSLNDPDHPDNPDDPDHPDDPESTMGAFYDDGIDDATDKTTLRAYAQKNDKHIGVALCTYKGYQSDRDESGKQFDLMVAENEMKMDALQPSQGQFSFGSADQLVSFAKNNNMSVRGHCLVWHQQQPGWLSSDGKKNDKNWSRAEALKILNDHITTVLQHFKGQVAEWDVVNECLDDDQSVIRTNPEGYTLRQTVWQRAIGDDYIDSAFVYARRADPSIALYLNDYDVEHQGKAKAVAFRNLVKHLQLRNIPIDGVGLQCHFSIGDVDSVKLDQTFRSFAEAGLKCIITELDMGTPSTSAKDLEEQARQYRIITDIVLNNDNCPEMVVWGIKDNDSWRSASNPLLYTSGLSKKPAWYAVRSALRHRAIMKEQQTGVECQKTVDEPAQRKAVYTLQGIRVGYADHWKELPAGIYIIDRKIIKR